MVLAPVKVKVKTSDRDEQLVFANRKIWRSSDSQRHETETLHSSPLNNEIIRLGAHDTARRDTKNREIIVIRVPKQYFPHNCKRNVRPPFLVNPATNRRLEYDNWCGPPTRLAVEVDGEQHYRWPNWFHRTREEFEAQVARDRLKDALSAANGVRLIRIPYTIKTTEPASYVYQQLDLLLFQ